MDKDESDKGPSGEDVVGGGAGKLEEGGVGEEKGEKRQKRERGKWKGVRLPWGGGG